jgi:hypothetical protein
VAEPRIQAVDSANSIDGVIDSLDTIIDESRKRNSRLGYFAALYREVTVQVRQGIVTGDFEDGTRMERLDIIFANRYLQALQRFQSGQQPTNSWRVAFQSAASWRMLILQHLLLGMNAHINVDLGVAAARTSPGTDLPSLQNDFNRINEILSNLLNRVQDKINALSPGFGFLDSVGGRTDEAIMNFSIQRARDAAWSVAEKLAPLSEAEQEREIARLDERIEALAQLVRNPGFLVRTVALAIRIFESSNISRNINVLF